MEREEELLEKTPWATTEIVLRKDFLWIVIHQLTFYNDKSQYVGKSHERAKLAQGSQISSYLSNSKSIHPSNYRLIT